MGFGAAAASFVLVVDAVVVVAVTIILRRTKYLVAFARVMLLVLVFMCVVPVGAEPEEQSWRP